MKRLLGIALCSLALGFTSTSIANDVSAEDQIKFRKAGYTFASWNMSKIKAQVIDGSVAYNQQQVESAANAIAAIANSGMGALFGPGTDKNVGNQRTRVKPELFTASDVPQLAGNFAKAASNLADVAKTGDQAKIRAAFSELGGTCKACHDKYRGNYQ